MKKYDLQFNDEIAQKIISDNELGRYNEVRKLLKIISLIEDNTVIAIDGDWGSGKTFFLKEIEHIIKNKKTRSQFNINMDISYNGNKEPFLNEQALDNSIILYYNAWENDLYREPLESILLTLLNSLKDNKNKVVTFKSFQKKLPKRIFEIFQGIGYNFVNQVNSSVERATGINAKKVVKSTIDLMEDINDLKTYEDLASSIITTEEIREAINELFTKVLKKGTRIIFIIDELDRCRPDYAVDLIETINHFYNNEKITFLIGVNLKEFRNTLKSFYGNNFDSYKYLHKFFDVIINLKRLDTNHYTTFALQNCSGHNMMPIEEAFNRTTLNYTNHTLLSILELANNYKFSLRDINRCLLMYDLIKINIEEILYNYEEDKKAQHAICYFIIPMMIISKVKNIDTVISFAEKRPDFNQICSTIDKEIIKKHEEKIGSPLDEMVTKYYQSFCKNHMYQEIINLI